MAAIKKVSIEFGTNFAIASVTMTDGLKTKMVGVIDDDGNRRWETEASNHNEEHEDFCEKIVDSCFMAIVDVITDDGSGT